MTRIISGGGKNSAGKAGTIPLGRPGFSRLLVGGMRRFRGQALTESASTLNIRNPADAILNTPLSKVSMLRQGKFASLATNLTGINNDLVFTAKARGVGGNAITVAYVDPGGVTATLGVSVTGNAITVNLGRAASTINTTANAIITAIQASTAASKLVSVALKTGNDGTGLVIAMAATNLAGADNGDFMPAMPSDAVPGAITPMPMDAGNSGYRKVPIENAPSASPERKIDRGKNRSVRYTGIGMGRVRNFTKRGR